MFELHIKPPTIKLVKLALPDPEQDLKRLRSCSPAIEILLSIDRRQGESRVAHPTAWVRTEASGMHPVRTLTEAWWH